MRLLIFTAGILTTSLGFVAEQVLKDLQLLQGAMTLGGGLIICGFFSGHPNWKWHGIVGAGVLALLGAARCAPAIFKLGQPQPSPELFQVIALIICLAVLIPIVRCLLAERARRQIEELEKGE